MYSRTLWIKRKHFNIAHSWNSLQLQKRDVKDPLVLGWMQMEYPKSLIRVIKNKEVHIFDRRKCFLNQN